MVGKLIVIDGTDGSGKETQAKLLISNLENSGQGTTYFSFPRHGDPSAYAVDEYLNGRFGGANDVNAYAGSIFYAVDRFAASFDIKAALNDGNFVICNRYVSANMGHQACKISDLKKRDEFLGWLDDLEYGKIFHIPRPDLTIILYVPTVVAQALVDKKDHRDYLGGKRRDIHEDDKKHLDDAAEAFVYVAKKYGWTIINCAPNNVMKSKEEIQKLVWLEVQKVLNK